ncbi:MAG: efflux RND transporter periplasmic adaptor subunit [Anaerolineae bacterium]
MKTKWWIAVLTLILAVGGAVGYSRWLKPEGARAQEEQVVTELVVVLRGTLQDSIEATGNLAPARERSLAFESAGRVHEVFVSEGDRVTEGQPLMQLETTSLEQAVEQARLSVEQAEAQLAQVKAGPSEAEIAAAEASLSSAKAAYAQVKAGASEETLAQLRAEMERAAKEVQQAQGNYQRAGESVRVGLQLQDATLAYEQARLAYEIALDVDDNDLASAWSKVEQAQAELDALLAGPTEEEVEAAELTLQSAELALTQAQRRLEEALLVAPFDGFVTDVGLAVGEMASGAAVVVVADLETLDVEIMLDETDIVKIGEGQAAQVSVEAFEDVIIPGEVVEIAPTGETASGVVLYPVTVRLAETPAQVRVGMTANVEIITEQWEDVRYLPQRAIQLEDDGAFVMLQTGSDEYTKTAVTLGKMLDGNVEILSGVNEGDVVGVFTDVPESEENAPNGMPLPGMGMFGGRRP